jgi:uncharacterized protein YgiB involved in biofilm formation
MVKTVESMDLTNLKQELQTLVDYARDACSTNGDLSSECAAAWDAVEEMQAATADRRSQEKTFFDRYCIERPDALECRIYDV